MIYTGYYAKLKKYEEAGLIPVAISGKVPDFYNGLTYREFAPRWEMFKRWKAGELDNIGYTEEYKKYLNTLDKEEIRYDFDSPHSCNNVILLCYEKSGDFCHRHILADWLEENFGYKVEEYKERGLIMEKINEIVTNGYVGALFLANPDFLPLERLEGQDCVQGGMYKGIPVKFVYEGLDNISNQELLSVNELKEIGVEFNLKNSLPEGTLKAFIEDKKLYLTTDSSFEKLIMGA